MRTEFIRIELLSFSELVKIMLHDIEEEMKEHEKSAAGASGRGVVMGQRYPPGGTPQWEFLDKKWRNLYDSVMGPMPHELPHEPMR